jgi:hypothetical protein
MVCPRNNSSVPAWSGSCPRTRTLWVAALCTVLSGCWASGQDVAMSNPTGDQFVGKNVEAVAARFGNPAGRKTLDNDQMLYVWELPAVTYASANQVADTGDAGLYGDGHNPGYMTDDRRMCKLSVTTSADGIVTQFNAEDLNGTGAPTRTLGLTGSVCAKRLGMKR